MDKRIFMTLLFSFLVCISVIVLVTCIWKLIKIFAKVKVEQKIEDLEALNCKKPDGSTTDGTKVPTKNPLFFMSPKEARNLRRLSILAGFDRARSTRRKSAPSSPFKSRSNANNGHEYERSVSENNSIKSSRVDIRLSNGISNENLGCLANILTCGCCIPIHEKLSQLLLESPSFEQDQSTRSKITKSASISSKRKEKSEVESPSLNSQQLKYNQGHASDEYLELIEKNCQTTGSKGSYFVISGWK